MSHMHFYEAWQPLVAIHFYCIEENGWEALHGRMKVIWAWMTWGRVNDSRIFIFGWTIHLKKKKTYLLYTNLFIYTIPYHPPEALISFLSSLKVKDNPTLFSSAGMILLSVGLRTHTLTNDHHCLHHILFIENGFSVY